MSTKIELTGQIWGSVAAGEGVSEIDLTVINSAITSHHGFPASSQVFSVPLNSCHGRK